MLDPTTNMPIIVLKDVNSDSVLPIWVGVFEANAIALEIEKVAPPRPMTHDLLKNAIVGLGATVERVVVTELRNDTFLAAIWATRNGEPIMIDSRPSDAIALAMRTDCPIFVDEEVLKSSRIATGSHRPHYRRRPAALAGGSQRRGRLRDAIAPSASAVAPLQSLQKHPRLFNLRKGCFRPRGTPCHAPSGGRRASLPDASGAASRDRRCTPWPAAVPGPGRTPC